MPGSLISDDPVDMLPVRVVPLVPRCERVADLPPVLFERLMVPDRDVRLLVVPVPPEPPVVDADEPDCPLVPPAVKPLVCAEAAALSASAATEASMVVMIFLDVSLFARSG